MSLELESPVFQTREQRLGSITRYQGNLHDLVQSGCGGGLKNRSRCLSTASSCSHGPAIGQLSGIEGVVAVDHSPIGCTAGQTGAQNLRGRAPTDPDVKIRQRRVFSTGTTEPDTVFGGTETLRDTVRIAFKRHRPRAIFITTSCVSSIIGDDVGEVVGSFAGSKIPVLFASTVGFKGEERRYYYVQKALPWIYRCKALPKEFFLLGGSGTALSVTKFLVNDIGLIPRVVYVTEDVPDEHRERVVELFSDLEAKTDFPVIVGSDGGIFEATATAETVQGRPAIFGSVLDEIYAKENLLPFVSISTPLGNNLVGESHYFGYQGGIRLFHEFYSAAAGSAVNLL